MSMQAESTKMLIQPFKILANLSTLMNTVTLEDFANEKLQKGYMNWEDAKLQDERRDQQNCSLSA